MCLRQSIFRFSHIPFANIIYFNETLYREEAKNGRKENSAQSSLGG